MINITSIREGIVIDHIKPGLGYELFQLLNLDKVDYTVALIINAHSKKYGRKDMIKIDSIVDLDFAAIGVLDPSITINYIKDEKIIEKKHITLPDVIEGSLKCTNPRCISTTERNVVSRFSLVDRDEKIYKCDYCDHYYNMED